MAGFSLTQIYFQATLEEYRYWEGFWKRCRCFFGLGFLGRGFGIKIETHCESVTIERNTGNRAMIDGDGKCNRKSEEGY